MYFLRNHAIPMGIYSLLILAAAILHVAGQPSLKDTPEAHRAGYRIDYSPREARPYTRLMRAPAPPLPMEKPYGARNTSSSYGDGLGAEETRVMLLKCASYYTIAARVFPDEEERYREAAIAALRKAQEFQKGTENWLDNQNSIFVSVFEEYLQGPSTGLGLYDRYNEICSRVVRPLLKSPTTGEK